MIRIIAITAAVAMTAADLSSALAQVAATPTWRDPQTGCSYLKLGDTLSLRYQRDGTPDCPNAPRSYGPGITAENVQEIARSIESLRRDIGAVRRELETLRHAVEESRPKR